MSQRNDTTALIGAFLITAGLVGGGFWWFTQQSGIKLNVSNNNNPATVPSDTNGQSATNSDGAGKFSEVQNVPSGLFNYGGSTSWAPLRLGVDPVIQQARPEFRLRYVEPVGSVPGSGTGIRMLIRDELAFSQSSRPLTDQELRQATQRGFKLRQVPIAIDGLAVAVNPSLNVTGLTLDQLANIYLGKIRNWQQIGGPNLPIVPLTRPISAGGTIELFVETVLQNRPFGANVQTVATTTEALRRLANAPGGIYFASAPEVVPQCTIKPLALGKRPDNLVPPYQEPLLTPSQCPAQRNRLNNSAFQSGQYPLTRNLYVIVKENGRVEQQAGDAYSNLLLTAEGQDAIARAGFVKIR